MKKNNSTIAKGFLMAGLITSILTTGNAFAANIPPAAQTPVNPTPKIEQAVDASIMHPMLTPEDYNEMELSMADYLKPFTFLTEAEKNRLLATDKEKAPYQKQLDELVKQVEKISAEIYQGSDAIWNDIDKIWSTEEALWQKLSETATEDQLKIDDFKEFIKASKTLNEDEKKRLLALEDKLDPYYAKLDAMDKKAENATADLGKQIDALFEKMEKIDEKDADIWAKIEKHETSQATQN